MDRRAFIATAAGFLAVPRATEAQSVPKTARIGILRLTSAPMPGKPHPASMGPFFEGLRELGWVEGQNVAFELRGGPDVEALAAELVGLKVDVIVAITTRPALAAQAATQTIPIVFAA